MAGRIRASDVDEVKRRTNLADLVGDYVTLKPGGIDSMKGLCPFHDERSPSFHVRPSLGYYHCFGCGESGDAISFVRAMDHLSFTEAVERLAGRLQYPLTYEDGGGRRDEGAGRARLLAANHAAAQWFVQQLAGEDGRTAREFLASRGFDSEACRRFGVGFAPRGWSGVIDHLRPQGFTPDELIQSGLVSEGRRGVYDRFRGRIMWPIRDTSGQTVGFGARRLFDDDTGPKYLNTPESPVYHKSRVLYGLDLAKRSISRSKRAVIVEGYTDVMACHLAGEESAVATCGTAFGREHIAVLRRVMGDDAAAEVIFTFDSDEAGQKAALRAFSEEKQFTAQTFVAHAPGGSDPADLRLERGDAAVRDMFTAKTPLFAFALQQAVSRYDLNTVEGRVLALRGAAPIVAQIKDQTLRPGYTRELARMLGLELDEVHRAVRSAGAQPRSVTDPIPPSREDSPGESRAAPRITLAALPQTPEVRLERDALMAMVQHPGAIGEDLMAQAVTAEVSHPPLREIRDALARAGNPEPREAWWDRVRASSPAEVQGLLRELAIAPMPQRDPARLADYARGVVIALLDRDLLSLKHELMARMQRMGDPADPGARRIAEQLTALEAARRALRTE